MTLYAGGFLGTMKKIHIKDRRVDWDFGRVMPYIHTIAITPDQRHLFAGGTKLLHFERGPAMDYNVKIERPVAGCVITSIIPEKNNQILFIGDVDGFVRRWDFTEQRTIKNYGSLFPGTRIEEIKFKDKKKMIVISKDGDYKEIFVGR